MHTFLHFVVSLQSRFYTLALVFVFDMNIYSPSLRLFKIDPVVSFLLATNRQSTIFPFSVVFTVTLTSRYFCFKYLDRVKLVIFQASDIAKRLSINQPRTQSILLLVSENGPGIGRSHDLKISSIWGVQL